MEIMVESSGELVESEDHESQGDKIGADHHYPVKVRVLETHFLRNQDDDTKAETKVSIQQTIAFG